MEAGTQQRLPAAPPHRHCLLTDISLQTPCSKNHIYIYILFATENTYTPNMYHMKDFFFFACTAEQDFSQDFKNTELKSLNPLRRLIHTLQTTQ